MRNVRDDWRGLSFALLRHPSDLDIRRRVVTKPTRS